MRFIRTNCILPLLLVAAACRADDSYPSLAPGDTYQQVVQQWGGPDRQDKKGSTETWIYGSGRVVFERGRVVAWMRPDVYRVRRAGRAHESSKIKDVLDELVNKPPEGLSARQPVP